MRNMAIFTVLATAAIVAFGDHPVVSNVTVSQDAVTRKVTVGYTLSGAPGIVTFDVLTNGVAVSPRLIQNYAGHVSRVVNPGAGRSFCWQPEPAWRGQSLDAGTLQVSVRAWATNDPPDYMVLNLRQRSAQPHWYTCADALPAGGLTNDLYRTARLVMRRIHAAGESFTMGSPTNELAREVIGTADKEPAHRVSFTDDYYLGVFEVTQRQWQYVMGTRHRCVFSNDTDWAVRPVENLDIVNVRRGNWPTATTPKMEAMDNFIARCIDSTGITGFDLPTEAQWEFACRAGTDTMFNSGFDSTARYQAQELKPLARFRYGGYYVNGDESVAPTGDVPAAEGGTARVGSYAPNAWGLYDMHGNVMEWCRDWYWQSLPTSLPEIEPGGPVTGTLDGEGLAHRVVRGGGYLSPSCECRSARRKRGNDTKLQTGFRLCYLLNR